MLLQKRKQFTTSDGIPVSDNQNSFTSGRRRPLLTQGEFFKSRMMIQILTEAQAGKTLCKPFDLTKVWLHKVFPLVELRIVDLNTNPENDYAEVEQFAFSPANVVPGISQSPDKMLQFRIFSCVDAHRYRLGVNYESLPVNKLRVPVSTCHRNYYMFICVLLGIMVLR